jgi:hypothetical protein
VRTVKKGHKKPVEVRSPDKSNKMPKKPLLVKKGTYGIIANPGINCGTDY